VTTTSTPRLNEETIERVRARIGIPTRSRTRSHNEVCSSDSFRHFARSYGDDNPLWSDPEYARASRFGASLGPPTYPISAGIARPVEWTPEEKEAMSGGDPLAGIGQYLCAERWLFSRPVLEGARLERVQALHAADLKPSRFGGGVGALVSHQMLWSDDRGPMAARMTDFWHAERDSSGKSAKYAGLERTHYTEEEMAAIDEAYAAEQVQGSTPRLFGSVSAGDSLGSIVKGPLTVTDILSYHVGIGWGGYGGGSTTLAYRNRMRIPKFYQRNEYGIWDSAQRCHWEDAWARQLGQPAAYDYGAMRTDWLVQLLTNWMGDHGWLWRLAVSVRRFNYMGDTQWLTGTVKSLKERPGAGAVEIELTSTNQRGEVTTSGKATVLLPLAAGESPAVPAFDEAFLLPAVAPGSDPAAGQ
jgi:acyl dehydratase